MQEREIDLENEVEALTEEMQEWADQQSKYDFGSDPYKRIEYEGSTLQRYQNGVAWAAQEFDTVTLRPITDGLRRAIRDLTEQTAFDRDQCLVAIGTQDAAYIAHDPETISPDNDDLQDTLGNIADLHPGYVDWASDKIQDLWGMSNELGNSYADMVLETQAKQTTTETTGSDTAE